MFCKVENSNLDFKQSNFQIINESLYYLLALLLSWQWDAHLQS